MFCIDCGSLYLIDGEGKCTNDCNSVSSGWYVNGISSTCDCAIGYTKIASGACFDCSTIDPYCMECSNETTCTVCGWWPDRFTFGGTSELHHLRTNANGKCVKPEAHCTTSDLNSYPCGGCTPGYYLSAEFTCPSCASKYG